MKSGQRQGTKFSVSPASSRLFLVLAGWKPAVRSGNDAMNEHYDTIQEPAFAALYEQHVDAAIALALSLTSDRALAEDAVQEAMLRIWRSAHSFHPGNVRGWVLRIVGRECMRLMRRRKQERTRATHVIPNQAGDSHNIAPDKEAVLSSIRTGLAKLAQPDRRLVELHFGDGLSQRQISAALAMPQQTISYRIRSVVGQLSRELVSTGLA
jgi:RNA polymerase sigma-70 factor (ECF subfamily)